MSITRFINKFKIPTILGLSIILLGIISGTFLVVRNEVFLSEAAPNFLPQDITFTNITEDSATISWQTSSAASSFITFGQNSPNEKTVLDIRDSSLQTSGPKPHLIHYVTIRNLLPKTKYQFKIISGKVNSDIFYFETTQPLEDQKGFTPIIGSVLNANIPLDDGVVYLSLPGAITQSAPVNTEGNFLIPISKVAKADLTGSLPLTEDMNVKLTISSTKGQASLLFKLKANLPTLPSIKLGQNLDLTTQEATPEPSPTTSDLNKYDLNGDGKINAADYAIVSSCFGKRTSATLPEGKSCNKADINIDGKINQKDLDLMTQKLKELGSK